MNELINFSLPAEKLSCFVGNLFTELEPPCSKEHFSDGLILCGRTPAGREAMLLIGSDRCTFIGNAEDYNAARNSPCPARRCCYGG